MKRSLGAPLALLLLSNAGACLDDWDLEEQLFACRAPGDCIEGFVCHPERFVCVTPAELPTPDAGAEGAAPDAGATDAASPD